MLVSFGVSFLFVAFDLIENSANGVQELLKQYYGANVVAAENGFNATIQVDTAKPPQDKVKLAHEVALLKRHCLGAPFYKCFNDIEAKKVISNMIEFGFNLLKRVEVL